MRDDRLLAYVRRATRAYDGSHDAEHAERVARNAARLCARADLRDVCVAAALAHDTCDPKYVADKEASLEALRTTLRTAARLPDARARLVVDVVREVSYTELRTRGPPRHLGADAYYAWSVVADADMLEAMGVVGVLRTLMYQGYARRPLDAAVDYAEAHLVSCAEHMSHAAARAEAAERARTMRALLASMRDAHASARHLRTSACTTARTAARSTSCAPRSPSAATGTRRCARRSRARPRGRGMETTRRRRGTGKRGSRGPVERACAPSVCVCVAKNAESFVRPRTSPSQEQPRERREARPHEHAQPRKGVAAGRRSAGGDLQVPVATERILDDEPHRRRPRHRDAARRHHGAQLGLVPVAQRARRLHPAPTRHTPRARTSSSASPARTTERTSGHASMGSVERGGGGDGGKGRGPRREGEGVREKD